MDSVSHDVPNVKLAFRFQVNGEVGHSLYANVRATIFLVNICKAVQAGKVAACDTHANLRNRNEAYDLLFRSQYDALSHTAELVH
ncbi:hypothetical protein NSS64_24755 [Paenibacillus sp. FSL H8-0122]|uniref:hypothetical protein n=1 Tax=Paenibacillus sp. FSL H8-0122 TaxID=2954510 RepID=UPI0030FBB424